MVKRKFREIDLFDFTSFFFALDFYNFLAHCGMLEVDWYTSCNMKRYFKGDSNIKTMSHIAYGGKNAQKL